LLVSVNRATVKVLSDAVFSMWFAPKLYHSTDRVRLVSAVQGSEELVSELVRELHFSLRELLLLEAGN
jgi:hypothetical protein